MLVVSIPAVFMVHLLPRESGRPDKEAYEAVPLGEADVDADLALAAAGVDADPCGAATAIAADGRESEEYEYADTASAGGESGAQKPPSSLPPIS